MRARMIRVTAGAAVLLTAAARAAASGDDNGKIEDPKIDAAAIWPAGLEKLAGRYVFAQVASPGGLWERTLPVPAGGTAPRQVSLNEIPAAFREKLTHASITIS